MAVNRVRIYIFSVTDLAICLVAEGIQAAASAC